MTEEHRFSDFFQKSRNINPTKEGNTTFEEQKRMWEDFYNVRQLSGWEDKEFFNNYSGTFVPTKTVETTSGILDSNLQPKEGPKYRSYYIDENGWLSSFPPKTKSIPSLPMTVYRHPEKPWVVRHVNNILFFEIEEGNKTVMSAILTDSDVLEGDQIKYLKSEPTLGMGHRELRERSLIAHIFEDRFERLIEANKIGRRN